MFRFTIRELVLVTMIVAMGFGWAIDRTQLDRDRARLRQAVGRYEMWGLDKALSVYAELAKSGTPFTIEMPRIVPRMTGPKSTPKSVAENDYHSQIQVE